MLINSPATQSPLFRSDHPSARAIIRGIRTIFERTSVFAGRNLSCYITQLFLVRARGYPCNLDTSIKKLSALTDQVSPFILNPLNPLGKKVYETQKLQKVVESLFFFL